MTITSHHYSVLNSNCFYWHHPFFPPPSSPGPFIHSFACPVWSAALASHLEVWFVKTTSLAKSALKPWNCLTLKLHCFEREHQSNCLAWLSSSVIGSTPPLSSLRRSPCLYCLAQTGIYCFASNSAAKVGQLCVSFTLRLAWCGKVVRRCRNQSLSKTGLRCLLWSWCFYSSFVATWFMGEMFHTPHLSSTGCLPTPTVVCPVFDSRKIDLPTTFFSQRLAKTLGSSWWSLWVELNVQKE